MTPLTSHEKSRIALRYWLQGKGEIMFPALRAMTKAEQLHDGLRKDAVTPEFAHQIWIANYLRTLPLSDVQLSVVLASAFFHDTPEDKGISFMEIETHTNSEVVEIVHLMTKKFRGEHVTPALYFAQLSGHGLAALLKGVDRLHNISSMAGVFSRSKQIAYLDETEQWHLPMLHKARKQFPELEAAFENVKMSLRLMIAMFRELHMTTAEVTPSAATPA